MVDLIQQALAAISVLAIRMVPIGFIVVAVGILLLYFPRVARFLMYLKKHDRMSFDLAGGMNPWSADSAQGFRQYFSLEHYKLLKDPEARALADKVMAAEKTLTRVAWVVLWSLLVSLVTAFAATIFQ